MADEGAQKPDSAAEAADGSSEGAPQAAPATAVAPQAPSAKVPRKLPRIRWRESWILRAAGMASLILFCGYATSAYFTIQSIDSMANLAYDEDVEAQLAAHVDDIKRIHDLRRKLIVERLRPFVDPWAKSQKPWPASKERVRKWLKRAQVTEFAPLDKLRVKKLPQDKVDPSDEALSWLNRDRLRILGFGITFPKGELYQSFQKAGEVKKRYHVVGEQLDREIRPTLVRAHTIILVLSFILLMGLFLLYARRFQRKIADVIAGFSEWSERNAGFRFGGSWKGELKLITAQFDIMADEVEANRKRSLFLEKLASWQVIARKLAHEIKNPLTPIQMVVSQLGRRYRGDDEEFRKLLDDAQKIVGEEVAGLRRMVDNFSRFAKLPMPEPKWIDLVPLGHRVIESQKATYDQHEFRFDPEVARAETEADEDLIRQVLTNLTKNAAEACKQQQATITLRISDSPHDYLLTVEDDGPGIPEELKERIFEAYFTTKHTGPSPGMGLGLAICQKIIMDHDGKMTVVSEPGHTAFTIRLPKKNHRDTGERRS